MLCPPVKHASQTLLGTPGSPRFPAMTAATVAARFRLAELLEEKGMTQSELARRSGVSQVTVNAIANNRTTRVDLATLDALSLELGVNPGELLEREEPRKGRRG
jgi:putative transcriptional regulator